MNDPASKYTAKTKRKTVYRTKVAFEGVETSILWLLVRIRDCFFVEKGDRPETDSLPFPFLEPSETGYYRVNLLSSIRCKTSPLYSKNHLHCSPILDG